MANLSLYQICNDYLSACANLLDNEEADSQTIADTLEGLKGTTEVKMQNIAAFFLNINSDVDSIKEAAKKMLKRAEILKNKSERIQKYLFDNMVRTGINKITCEYFNISIKDNPPSLIIDDEKSIPKIYFTVETVEILDKAALKHDLKNGEIIKGAHLEIKKRLDIK